MAADIFAKLGDIKGESQDSKHKDEIEVLSWSWGVSTSTGSGPGGGGGAGKASFQDLSLTHGFDRASPQLLQACATGQHIKDATITQRKAGKSSHEYLIIKMEHILITGCQTTGSDGQDQLVEQVSLNFKRVGLKYTPQKDDGTGWKHVRALKLPKPVRFVDYSGIDVVGNRVAVVSQESSALWLGRLNPDLTFADDGEVFLFPTWASPGPLEVAAAAVVPDAQALHAPQGSCGPLLVERGDGTTVPMRGGSTT